jgi:hypothetical protein
MMGSACLAATHIPVGIPVPAPDVPTSGEVRTIVEALLTNIHRAFEYPDESRVYDRLSVSVSGDVLSDIFLEQRKTLELARRGGARARADSVEVTDVEHVEPLEGGRFQVKAQWRLSGHVVHFGHRHYRRNHYAADLQIEPVDGNWKIYAMEVTGKERLR